MILKLPLLLLLLAASALTPDQQHFRYQRQILIAPGAQQPQACAILTPDLFAHASGSLADLRLYQQQGSAAPETTGELPYALTLSEAATPTDDPATVLNLGARSGHIVFDLDMPARSYTSLTLNLDARDFLATAKVSTPTGTGLGEFTLFDLTSQHLSRSTTLNLQESNFPRLHLDLTLTPAPGSPTRAFPPTLVTGASVPPSREAQTLYTVVAETSTFTQKDRHTIAEFHVPARVPIERIEFVLPPNFHSNFSRTVQISAHADKPSTPGSSTPEQLSGEISRVQLTQAGRPIHSQQLTIPATLGANLQSDATVQVSVDNGDDRPVPFAAVRLAMRQRELCFEPPANSASPTLFYGDSDLHAPIYDYARLFRPSATPALATLAPEQLNPAYTPRTDTRPLTERHPELLWIVLILVIGILGVVALRSTRYLPR